MRYHEAVKVRNFKSNQQPVPQSEDSVFLAPKRASTQQSIKSRSNVTYQLATIRYRQIMSNGKVK